MPYCPRCGVEADPSVRNCPLCETAIPAFADLGPGEPAWPSPADRNPDLDPSKTYATPGELRSRAFVAVTGVFATAALAVASTDLFLNHTVTWARYPLAALAAVFLLTAAVFAWHRQPRSWGLAWAVVTAAFLTSLDAVDGGGFGWAPTLGVPVAVLSFGLIFAGVEAVRRSRRRGYNLFGLVPALVTLDLLGIDALVSAWTVGRVVLGWSLVAALVLVPLTLLFFFLHYALHRTPDLRRTFHF